MDPVTIALGIANFAAPKLAKWLGGDKGEEVANDVLDIAKTVTGQADSGEAFGALKADAEQLLQFQRQAQKLEVRILEEETKRLQAVNQTMQAEYASNDKYVKRWRPTFGYVMAATWALQILGTVIGMLYAVIKAPKTAGAILEGIAAANAATVPMWAVALSVIGVSVWKRSRDKEVAAGQGGGLGMMTAIAQRIAGGR